MKLHTRRALRARHPLFAAIAATLLPLPLYAAGLSPHARLDHVVLPPGSYAGNEPGLELIQDYGAFQLWRLDAAHRAELQAATRGPLRLESRQIDLPAGRFDPLDSDAVAPAHLRPSARYEGPSVHVVQFVGPVHDAWLEEVRANGAQLVQYVNDNAYLVIADEAAARRLERLSLAGRFLRYTGRVESFRKVTPQLDAQVRQANAGDLTVTVVLAQHAAVGTSQRRIEALGTPLSGWADLRGMQAMRLRVPASRIADLAGFGDVLAVEPAGTRRKLDEVQGQIIAGNLNATNTAPSGTGYLAWLTGHGFSTTPTDYPLIAIVDDGIGNGTTTLGAGDERLTVDGLNSASRVAFATSCTSASAAGDGGHGHINATIAAGYDQRAGAPFRDPQGYLRGQGINPFARVANFQIFGAGDSGNCGVEDAGMIAAQGAQNVKVSNNSWGYIDQFQNPIVTYDTPSRAYDAGVRDANAALAGNQPLLFVFAAGNDGPTANTVGSPGNAKNVLTVGASENVRPSDEDGAWTDGCGTSGSGANSAMDVIPFSSRGPARGGRVKPEIIAPGTHVQGSASTSSGYDGTGVCDQYRPSGQTEFAASSGTSHSAPAVAGAASLVYRHLQTEYGLGDPSPAMNKAYLFAHPTYLNGTGANDNLPSNTQGYGMPDLDAAFDPATARVLVDQTTRLAATGETFTLPGAVDDTGKPLRIVLAWTDAPGAVGNPATPSVNDLNLEVVVNGTLYRGNVFSGAFSTTGGSADAVNNYEAVFLPAGTSGPITITVTGQNVAGDGVPGDAGADATDQDFALVCSNCSQLPQFSIDATPSSVQSCGASGADWNVAVGALFGYTGNVALQALGVPAPALADLAPPNGAAPFASAFSLDTTGLAAGDYALQVQGDDGVTQRTDTVMLQHSAALPDAAAPQAPADGATAVAVQPTLSWTAVPGAVDYVVEVDDDAGFGSLAYSAVVGGTSHALGSALTPVTQYFWRVRARNHCGTAADSATFAFTTANLVCSTFVSTEVPRAIPDVASVNSAVAVAGFGAGAQVTDVDVLGLRIDHNWFEDVDADLISPAATTLRVFGDLCGSGDDMHANLDDAAAGIIGDTCPPGAFAGAAITARPQNALAAFNGQGADGTWTLRLADDEAIITGTLQSWSLRVCATIAATVNAADDDYDASEDTQLDVAAPGVLGNDTPGGALSATLVSPPASGTLDLQADGSFSYLPAPDACGSVSFTYSASDGGGSDTATATIDVACSNDAPTVATPLADRTDAEGTAVNASLAGAFADVDAGQTLSFGATTLPAGISLSSDGMLSGTIGFAAAAGSPYAVQVTADDGNGGSVSDTFQWTVTDANQPPTVVAAGIADRSDDEGDAVNVDLSVHFDDAEGQNLTFSSDDPLPEGISLGSNGQLAGTIGFAAAADSPYTVEVWADDGAGGQVSDTFVWSVANSNRAPSFGSDAYAFGVVNGATGGSLLGTVSASDPDTGAGGGAGVTFAITAGNDAGAFAIDPLSGELRVASSAALGAAGTVHTLTLGVSDGQGGSDSATVQITVLATRIFQDGLEGQD